MKRIKMIIAAALITLTAATMTACNAENTEIEETDSGKASAFVQVEKTNQWRIVYHRETKVMYAVSLGYARGVFTVLVNADGTPMIYRDGKDIPRVAP